MWPWERLEPRLGVIERRQGVRDQRRDKCWVQREKVENCQLQAMEANRAHVAVRGDIKVKGKEPL